MSDTSKHINPFLFTPIQTIKIVEKYQTIHEASGRITSYHTQEYEVDQHDSVTLYHIPTLIEAHASLSKAGMHLFLYIIGNSLKKNSDIIELSPSDSHAMSSATFSRAIQSLTENNFVARKSNGVYWLNPHLFFPGRRVTALKTKYGEQATEIKAVIAK